MDTYANFNLSRSSRVKITSSIVLRMIDCYTGKAPTTSGLSVTIEGLLQRPIAKGNEYFVFTNLQHGKYRIIVRSNHYLFVEKEVIVDEEERIFNIMLFPNKAYPLQENATMILFRLRNALDEPLCCKKVVLTVTDPKCAVAKVAEEQLESGKDVIKVAKLSEIFIGDQFLLVDRENEKSEYCEITENLEGYANYRLSRSITQSFSRGSLLLPVSITYTDENGETILLVRSSAKNSFQAILTVELGENHFTKELVICNGEKKNLGVVKVS